MRINSLNKTFLCKLMATSSPLHTPRAALSSPQPKPCSGHPALPAPAMLLPTTPQKSPWTKQDPAVGHISFGLLCVNVKYCLADTLGLFLDVNEDQMESGAVWAVLICSVKLFDCFYFIFFYPFSTKQNQQTISSVMKLLLLSAELAGLEEHRRINPGWKQGNEGLLSAQMQQGEQRGMLIVRAGLTPYSCAGCAEDVGQKNRHSQG